MTNMTPAIPDDPDDVSFVTQFFSITADGIWFDDHYFKKQSKIPIYRTKELVRIFKHYS